MRLIVIAKDGVQRWMSKRWIVLNCFLFGSGLLLLINYHFKVHQQGGGFEYDIRNPSTADLLQKSRIKRLERICREQNMTGNVSTIITQQQSSDGILIPSHFHLASNYKTMGCFVNKVASSSFVSAFLRIQGFTSSLEDNPYTVHGMSHRLLPKSLEEFQKANLTHFKFMIVRHPMDRMLSAYQDKMVSKPDKNFLPPYRRCIQRRGHNIILNRIHNKRQSDSLPILNCTLQEAMRVGNMEDGQHSTQPDSNTAAEIPTFAEFLEFVLSTDLHGLSGYVDIAHSHWVPFHRYCSPCSVKFDAIGKLETAANDFEYIWNKSGLHMSGVQIPTVNTKIPPDSKSELEKRHYSSLPRELILRFYDAFRMDFELFDYSINDILLKAGYTPLVARQV